MVHWELLRRRSLGTTNIEAMNELGQWVTSGHLVSRKLQSYLNLRGGYFRSDFLFWREMKILCKIYPVEVMLHPVLHISHTI